MAGVTAEGFILKRQDEIFAEMRDEVLDEISSRMDTSSASAMGQLLGILSSKIAEPWEVAQAVWTFSRFRHASNFALDSLIKLMGVTRKDATKSIVALTININAGVTVPAGSIVADAADGTARFATNVAVTNSGGVAANFTVLATAEDFGPVRGNAGTLTTIVSAVPGWNTVTNVLDATQGAFAETDYQLRKRYETDVFGNASGTVSAIKAKLERVTGIQKATVFENPLDVVDGFGLPPHSIECVVFDGPSPVVADTLIAQTIEDNKGAATATHGTTTASATNANGNVVSIKFSRPTTLNIYVSIDVRVNNEDFPSDGATAIKQVVSDYGDANQNVGDDVIVSALSQAVFDVPGVLDVVALRVGTAPSPTQTTNLAISNRELADLDTSRVTVNVL